MKNILVTGGCGFIGSNFLRLMCTKYPNYNFVNLDKLTYAGNLENLDGVNSANYFFEKVDICDSLKVKTVFEKYAIDTVINFAAESHVDRSIFGAFDFIQTNIVGTQILLENAKEFQVEKFLQISTDEVYGSLSDTGKFTETTPLHPNSTYSASKSSADLIALAYHHTFGLNVLITRCSNNYGPYQFPEKLIPLMIINALNNISLPIYGNGMNVRDWLYVEDHCLAIDSVLHIGKFGEVYNIGGNNEWRNIDIVKLILKKLNKPESLIAFVKDRLGHDFRYAIDSSKITNELNWKPIYDFENGISNTINWYLENKTWWKKIISGEYKNYYKLQYEKARS